MKRREHFPRITLVLESQYDVIGVSDRNNFTGGTAPPPLSYPEVEDMM
jgi:hypothetical protein